MILHLRRQFARNLEGSGRYFLDKEQPWQSLRGADQISAKRQWKRACLSIQSIANSCIYTEPPCKHLSHNKQAQTERNFNQLQRIGLDLQAKESPR